MLKKLILGLLIASTSINLFAQTDSTQAKKPPRWEVAVDLLSLTNKAVLPPHLFARRHFKNNSALRLRLGISNRQTKLLPYVSVYGNDDVNTRDYQDKKFTLRLDVGYEWNKKIISNFFILYGIDMFWDKVDTRSLVYLNQPEPSGDIDLQTTSAFDNIYGVSLNGGVKYFLRRHIAISIEAGLQYTYNTLDFKTKKEPYIVQSLQPVDGGSLIFSPKRESLITILPIRSIYLLFYF